jgi:hypothetical protein
MWLAFDAQLDFATLFQKIHETQQTVMLLELEKRWSHQDWTELTLCLRERTCAGLRAVLDVTQSARDVLQDCSTVFAFFDQTGISKDREILLLFMTLALKTCRVVICQEKSREAYKNQVGQLKLRWLPHFTVENYGELVQLATEFWRVNGLL